MGAPVKTAASPAGSHHALGSPHSGNRTKVGLPFRDSAAGGGNSDGRPPADRISERITTAADRAVTAASAVAVARGPTVSAYDYRRLPGFLPGVGALATPRGAVDYRLRRIDRRNDVLAGGVEANNAASGYTLYSVQGAVTAAGGQPAFTTAQQSFIILPPQKSTGAAEFTRESFYTVRESLASNASSSKRRALDHQQRHHLAEQQDQQAGSEQRPDNRDSHHDHATLDHHNTPSQSRSAAPAVAAPAVSSNTQTCWSPPAHFGTTATLSNGISACYSGAGSTLASPRHRSLVIRQVMPSVDHTTGGATEGPNPGAASGNPHFLGNVNDAAAATSRFGHQLGCRAVPRLPLHRHGPATAAVLNYGSNAVATAGGQGGGDSNSPVLLPGHVPRPVGGGSSASVSAVPPFGGSANAVQLALPPQLAPGRPVQLPLGLHSVLQPSSVSLHGTNGSGGAITSRCHGPPIDRPSTAAATVLPSTGHPPAGSYRPAPHRRLVAAVGKGPFLNGESKSDMIRSKLLARGGVSGPPVQRLNPAAAAAVGAVSQLQEGQFSRPSTGLSGPDTVPGTLTAAGYSSTRNTQRVDLLASTNPRHEQQDIQPQGASVFSSVGIARRRQLHQPPEEPPSSNRMCTNEVDPQVTLSSSSASSTVADTGAEQGPSNNQALGDRAVGDFLPDHNSLPQPPATARPHYNRPLQPYMRTAGLGYPPHPPPSSVHCDEAVASEQQAHDLMKSNAAATNLIQPSALGEPSTVSSTVVTGLAAASASAYSKRHSLTDNGNAENSQLAVIAPIAFHPSQFETVAMIGQGGYAVVRVARSKMSGMVFALKQVAKSDFPNVTQLRMAFTEAAILLTRERQALQAHGRAPPIRSTSGAKTLKSKRAPILDMLATKGADFFPRFYGAWQDQHFIYFLMEYLPGGDLMKHLIDRETFPEQTAKFYTAQIAIAIGYMHDHLSYVHRDIKPDNVLFDAQGNIKLLDFGLSRKLDQPPRRSPDGKHWIFPEHFSSAVGTPDYMAPEVHRQGVAHDRTCDWWSLGIILYEMLFGGPPLSDLNHRPEITSRLIRNWKSFLTQWPQKPPVSDLGKDLLNKLIAEKEDRYQTVEEVLSHPWFADLDLDRIRHMGAPIVPEITGPSDVQNFDRFSLNRLLQWEQKKREAQTAPEVQSTLLDLRHPRAAGHDNLPTIPFVQAASVRGGGQTPSSKFRAIPNRPMTADSSFLTGGSLAGSTASTAAPPLSATSALVGSNIPRKTTAEAAAAVMQLDLESFMTHRDYLPSAPLSSHMGCPPQPTFGQPRYVTVPRRQQLQNASHSILGGTQEFTCGPLDDIGVTRRRLVVQPVISGSMTARPAAGGMGPGSSLQRNGPGAHGGHHPPRGAGPGIMPASGSEATNDSAHCAQPAVGYGGRKDIDRWVTEVSANRMGGGGLTARGELAQRLTPLISPDMSHDRPSGCLTARGRGGAATEVAAAGGLSGSATKTRQLRKQQQQLLHGGTGGVVAGAVPASTAAPVAAPHGERTGSSQRSSLDVRSTRDTPGLGGAAAPDSQGGSALQHEEASPMDNSLSRQQPMDTKGSATSLDSKHGASPPEQNGRGLLQGLKQHVTRWLTSSSSSSHASGVPVAALDRSHACCLPAAAVFSSSVESLVVGKSGSRLSISTVKNANSHSDGTGGGSAGGQMNITEDSIATSSAQSRVRQEVQNAPKTTLVHSTGVQCSNSFVSPR